MGGRLAAGAVKIANARGEATRQRRRANFYVVKPFPSTKLTARIQTALRRRQTSAPLVLGGLFIDYDPRRVTVADARAHLTETEFQLPAVLLINADRVPTFAGRRCAGSGRGTPAPLLRRCEHSSRDLDASSATIRTSRPTSSTCGAGFRMARPGSTGRQASPW